MNKEVALHDQLYAEKLKQFKLTEVDVASIFSIADLNEWMQSGIREKLIVAIGTKVSSEISQENKEIQYEIHCTLLHLYKDMLHESDLESWFKISKRRRAAKILLKLI